MSEIAKGLILLGALFIVLGLAILAVQKVPFLGKLPGDILIKRDNFTFSFPLATGVVVSLLVSLILTLIGKFRP